VSRLARRTLGASGLVAVVGVLGAGCLTRPVSRGEPSLKTNFTAEVRQAAVDKVDLLFAIDNSASMGDKQSLLSQAVPDLMTRLITPNCVDAQGNPNGSVAAADGTCAQGKPEFQPVHDMHIGIVTSSLGGRGSDQCSAATPNPVDGTLNGHNDDSGHLINRGGDTEAPVGDADQGNGSAFLAWFPQTDKNTGHATPTKGVANPGTLNSDFQQMVVGVHQYGCGFEAQLESWYRFLIQPDPYKTISAPDKNGLVSLQDVDTVILQQRADFLRPDSLVAIIQLTDENESTVDPLALSGQGWAYENLSFPGSPTGGAAKGTSACASNPLDTKCSSCGFCRSGSEPECSDSVCAATDKGYYATTDDSLNERMFHMKQRFGVDPQFPATRYVTGLTQRKVPDRLGEHPLNSQNLPSNNYVGTNDCSNPLFATNLPKTYDPSNPDSICTLQPGPRTPDLVYYAAVAGVPWQLLLKNPTPPYQGDFKDSIAEADWTALIGADPLNYNFSGADPHMIESLTARSGINAGDPIVGSDWTTGGADLEYACTFPLPDAPRDCTTNANKFACDCDGKKDTPLCDPNDKTKQLRGKAYPTIKELAVARAMKDQGIVASLCPRTDGSGALLPNTNQDFGYRPAVRSIINRLKNALANQCLPQKLIADQTGEVPCLILLTLTGSPGDESTCTQRGFDIPDAAILAKFRQTQHSDYLANGGDKSGAQDPSTFPTCQLKQIVETPGASCANDPGAGWCYVVNAGGQTPAGTCSQAILFTQSGNPSGATISLQCIEANTVQDGGPGSAPTTGSE
jgi:hypothetical protein